MRQHFSNDTEPIFALLDRYRADLSAHPLVDAARRHDISDQTLREFAYCQYVDSITWIPMLAQMKSKTSRSRRLHDAIADNIGHEAGLHGTSHVTLAVAMMRGLGLTELDAHAASQLAAVGSLWLSDDFATFTEPEIAGWLLVAETLVPILFAAFEPCFAKHGDTRYFTEHVAIDADQHAMWMAAAVDDVVAEYGPGCVPEVLAGMTDAWGETISVPDALWRRSCASR